MCAGDEIAAVCPVRTPELTLDEDLARRAHDRLGAEDAGRLDQRRPSPHLHCLRHSFAVGTLLRWYREGVDPMARLFDLSTFLGHVSPSSTAVYLTITTELLECANGRFAEFAAKSRKESIR